MIEQFPSPTHDIPRQPTLAEAIKLISAVIDPEIAERMLQEYQEGRAIVAEDARLEADTAECIQHQRLVAEQIKKNDLRRQDLAPKLADVLQKEADLRVLIDGLARLVRNEPAVEVTVASREVRPSLAAPPLPAHDPKPAVERRPLGEFRDMAVRRPLGVRALAQDRLNTAVKGN
jgi:hypothetical protein